MHSARAESSFHGTWDTRFFSIVVFSSGLWVTSATGLVAMLGAHASSLHLLYSISVFVVTFLFLPPFSLPPFMHLLKVGEEEVLKEPLGFA